MFAHLMHIRPWEADLLTVQQFDAAIEDIDEYLRQRQRNNSRDDE